MISYIAIWLAYGAIAAMILGPWSFMMVHMSSKQSLSKAFAFVVGINTAEPIIATLAYVAMSYFLDGNNFTTIALGGYIATAISIIMWVVMISNKISLTQKTSDIHQWLGHVYAFTKWLLVQWTSLFSRTVGIAVSSYFILNDTLYGFIFFVWTVFTVTFFVDILKIYYAKKIAKKLTPKSIRRVQISIGILLIVLWLFIGYQTNICNKNIDTCIQDSQQQFQQFFDNTQHSTP